MAGLELDVVPFDGPLAYRASPLRSRPEAWACPSAIELASAWAFSVGSGLDDRSALASWSFSVEIRAIRCLPHEADPRPDCVATPTAEAGLYRGDTFSIEVDRHT